jgi:hypothetical protein
MTVLMVVDSMKESVLLNPQVQEASHIVEYPRDSVQSSRVAVSLLKAEAVFGHTVMSKTDIVRSGRVRKEDDFVRECF